MINVGELIDALEKHPRDMKVYVEAKSDFVVSTGDYDIIFVGVVEKYINDTDKRKYLVIEALEYQ